MTVQNDKENYMREHLHYEVQMLRYTHERLKSPLYQLLANALMESFVVHARNLMDFLYNQFDPKCFCAADFLPAGHEAAKKIPFGPAGKAYGLAHEQTLHLGQRRPISADEKVGPEERQQLRDAIESQLAIFEKEMAPDFKKIWDKAKLDLEKSNNPETLKLSDLVRPSATGAIHGVTGPGKPSSR